MENIRVELGADSYNIFIGEKILADVAKFIAESNFTKKVLIVADGNTEKFCTGLTAELETRDINFDVAIIPAGESSKNLREAEKLYTRAIEFGMDRKSPVVAFGGGVVGDLAGFVAATYLRGVPFIQVPTTLLAQVDSSVGGKTAVNHELGKNLIGAFYQPKAVFIDIDTIKTLPERELRCGLGEVVKYGIISDEKFFEYLELNVKKILSRDVEVLTSIIKRACEIKADVVSKDEKESGLRRILNFGHTIAHAVEQVTNYEKYRHGEAVAVGMLGAALISYAMGKITFNDVARLKDLLDRLGLITRCADCDVEEMYALTFRDKKIIDGKINWVLMENFGKVFVTDEVAEVEIKKALKILAS